MIEDITFKIGFYDELYEIQKNIGNMIQKESGLKKQMLKDTWETIDQIITIYQDHISKLDRRF